MAYWSDSPSWVGVPRPQLRESLHRLSNAVSAVSGISGVLRTSPDPEATRRLLDRLDERARALAEAVHELRSLADGSVSPSPTWRESEPAPPAASSTQTTRSMIEHADTSPSVAASTDPQPVTASRGAAPSLAIREVIDGTYVVEECLGEGGMGTVYRARDTTLDRDVAIKLLTSSLWSDEASRDTFLREARALAQIRHAHVVGIHALGTRGDAPYIVMDLIDGPTLRERLRGDTTLAPRRGLELLDQLCDGLAAMHAAGLVHRDVKPSNLMVDRDGQLAITDLGLALPLGSPLDPAVHVRGGTPGFSAPEVFDAARPHLSDQVDVYGVGVVAFEIFAGHRAFPQDDAGERLRAQREAPPSLVSLRPDLSSQLTQLVDACLSASPQRRPASIDVVRDSLRRARSELGAFQHLKVVVADDDPQVRHHTTALLRRQLQGCQVLGFQRGQDALRAVSRDQPHLLVTDLDMPGMDGRALVHAVRKQSDVPVLVVSGVGSPDDWRDLRRLGAGAFLPKPLDERSLGAVARSLVGTAGP